MEGGSPLQPCDGAGDIYHDVGVSAEYWGELIKEEKNLDELRAGYSICLIHLRDAAAEIAELRLEGLRLGVNHSSLSSLRRRLLVQHGMLTPTVDPVPMQNMEEIQRDEERIVLVVKDFCVGTHHQEMTTAECLNTHRLAVQKLYVCAHSLDVDQERQAVGEMLRQAKMLLRQVDARYKGYSLILRLTLEEIVRCRVENNKIREMNASMSSFIHSLQQYRGRSAAPTREGGGVESQLRPQNCTTKMCNNWKRGGTCTYGERCWFVHGQQEPRHRSPPHPPYNTKPCAYFLSASGCKKGDNCGYLHGCPPPE